MTERTFPSRRYEAVVEFKVSYEVPSSDAEEEEEDEDSFDYEDVELSPDLYGTPEEVDKEVITGLTHEVVKVKSGQFENMLMGDIASVKFVEEGEVTYGD